MEKKALEAALVRAFIERDAAVKQTDEAFKALKEVRGGHRKMPGDGKEDAVRKMVEKHISWWKTMKPDEICVEEVEVALKSEEIEFKYEQL